jgi:hypothetical protein
MLDKQLLRDDRDLLTLLCDEAKTKQLSRMILDCEADQRKLFSAVGDRLLVKPTRKLPEHNSLQQLADDFIAFFADKPTKLRAELDSRLSGANDEEDVAEMAVPNKIFLIEFPQVSHSDVIEMVKLCPTKSCSLDPIPTSLLKTVIDVLAVPIASLYNFSVSTGVFPSKLKIGLISPVIKKPNLCPRPFNNFRPITNVAFSSKCLERLAYFTLVHHLSSNNLFVSVQSAYRANHSTETLLLSV